MGEDQLPGPRTQPYTLERGARLYSLEDGPGRCDQTDWTD
jgi:hypothetical protein